LTSIYGVLAMARIHNQNPRTYAEIMSTKGDGRKIVKTFAENLLKIIDLAEKEEIDMLCEIMENSRRFMTPSFLDARMKQAKAVDGVLNESGINYSY
jgi:prephenate dehydrogenase